MSGACLEVRWLRVGAGGRVVIRTSGWWERYRAWRERRAPRVLFHAVLDVFDGDSRSVIEMTPVWGRAPLSRGVVATGPVGARFLGRSRWFRYEVRSRAVDSTHESREAARWRLPVSRTSAEAVLRIAKETPCFTWGRDVFRIGDLWTSNSVVSWLLQSAGVDASRVRPPDDGVAPGWESGIVAALARDADEPGTPAGSRRR